MTSESIAGPWGPPGHQHLASIQGIFYLSSFSQTQSQVWPNARKTWKRRLAVRRGNTVGFLSIQHRRCGGPECSSQMRVDLGFVGLKLTPVWGLL